MSDGKALIENRQRIEKYKALTNEEVEAICIFATDLIVAAVKAVEFEAIDNLAPEGMSDVQKQAVHDILQHGETEEYLRRLLNA